MTSFLNDPQGVSLIASPKQPGQLLCYNMLNKVRKAKNTIISIKDQLASLGAPISTNTNYH